MDDRTDVGVLVCCYGGHAFSFSRRLPVPRPKNKSLELPFRGRKERCPAEPVKERAGFDTVGLFAGIGGIELGLSRAGHHTRLLCEIDPAARAVLEPRF